MDQELLNLKIENAQLKLQILEMHTLISRFESEKVYGALQNLLKEKEEPKNEELA